jgi:hypothetical protein
VQITLEEREQMRACEGDALSVEMYRTKHSLQEMEEDVRLVPNRTINPLL